MNQPSFSCAHTSAEWFTKADYEHRRRLSGLWEAYSTEDRNFLALSLCGEVGELANKIKKHWDGRAEPPSRGEIAEEIADVRILLELLAHSMAIEIETAVQEKLEEISRRCHNLKVSTDTRASEIPHLRAPGHTTPCAFAGNLPKSPQVTDSK